MSRPPANHSDEILDRQALRSADRDTYGANAHHIQDPSQIVMMMEERGAGQMAERDRHALRQEIFAGLCGYLLVRGVEPEAVRMGIEALFANCAPALAGKIKGPREWVAPEAVERALRSIGRPADSWPRGRILLNEWCADLARESDEAMVRSCLQLLAESLLCEGRTWRGTVAVAYCLCKALRPEQVADLSMEVIAALSGDKGRATVQARLKRIYNRKVAAAGSRATQVPCQKAASASATFAAAQMGNTNRRKAGERRDGFLKRL